MRHIALLMNRTVSIHYVSPLIVLTLKVPATIIDALRHFEKDNYSTVRGDGGSRVGEVRAGTTSPMPEHKGFMLQLTIRDPPTHTSSSRVNMCNSSQ